LRGVSELHGTFLIAAGAGLKKQCCASINFSTYQGFFFFFSHAWHVWYLLLFCGWYEFSMLIFTAGGMCIDDETLQNFINEHTIGLENVQRNF